MVKKATDYSAVFFFLLLFGIPLSFLYFFSQEAFAGGLFIIIYFSLFMLIDDARTFRG
jgi:hypothetical protein